MAMEIVNVHRRDIAADPASVGQLIDTLASADDKLWPRKWPTMRFAGGLQAGNHGGHGPVRYSIEKHVPGREILFRFSGDGPPGLTGQHGYRVLAAGAGCVLVHEAKGNAYGMCRLTWPLVFRALHDALIEDSLDTAQRQATGQPPPVPARWSRRVRLLRWVARRLR